MIGAIYQPLNALECTDFVNARKVMLSDTSRLINGSYLELGQQGPIRFIFQTDTDGFDPAAYYLLDP